MYYCLVPAAAYACEEIFHSIPDAYGEYVCADMCVCVCVRYANAHTERDSEHIAIQHTSNAPFSITLCSVSLVYPTPKSVHTLCLCVYSYSYALN